MENHGASQASKHSFPMNRLVRSGWPHGVSRPVLAASLEANLCSLLLRDEPKASPQGSLRSWGALGKEFGGCPGLQRAKTRSRTGTQNQNWSRPPPHAATTNFATAENNIRANRKGASPNHPVMPCTSGPNNVGPVCGLFMQVSGPNQSRIMSNP
jgi:hypothetical protein